MAKKFNPITPPFDYYEPSTVPGGSDGQFQYNDGGSFAGCSDFKYNKTTKQFTFGSGEAGVDYQILFDGQTQDGVLDWFEDEGTFCFTRSGVTPWWYSGGYDPILAATVRGGTGVTTGFWASTGTKTNMSELFSFWGGVFDEGSNAKGMTSGGFGAAGLFCYNAFWASNTRTYPLVAAVSGLSETSGASNLTITDLAGAIFQYNDDAGTSNTFTRAYGVWIKDGVGATTAYGLKINNIASGISASYAIYTGTGQIRFGGAFGCNGATPQGKYTVNAASSDLATVIALTNQIRTALINNGICV